MKWNQGLLLSLHLWQWDAMKWSEERLPHPSLPSTNFSGRHEKKEKIRQKKAALKKNFGIIQVSKQPEKVASAAATVQKHKGSLLPACSLSAAACTLWCTEELNPVGNARQLFSLSCMWKFEGAWGRSLHGRPHVQNFTFKLASFPHSLIAYVISCPLNQIAVQLPASMQHKLAARTGSGSWQCAPRPACACVHHCDASCSTPNCRMLCPSGRSWGGTRPTRRRKHGWWSKSCKRCGVAHLVLDHNCTSSTFELSRALHCILLGSRIKGCLSLRVARGTQTQCCACSRSSQPEYLTCMHHCVQLAAASAAAIMLKYCHLLLTHVEA